MVRTNRSSCRRRLISCRPVLINAIPYFLSRLDGTPYRSTFASYLSTSFMASNFLFLAHATATSSPVRHSFPFQSRIETDGLTTVDRCVVDQSDHTHPVDPDGAADTQHIHPSCTWRPIHVCYPQWNRTGRRWRVHADRRGRRSIAFRVVGHANHHGRKCCSRRCRQYGPGRCSCRVGLGIAR